MAGAGGSLFYAMGDLHSWKQASTPPTIALPRGLAKALGASLWFFIFYGLGEWYMNVHLFRTKTMTYVQTRCSRTPGMLTTHFPLHFVETLTRDRAGDILGTVTVTATVTATRSTTRRDGQLDVWDCIGMHESQKAEGSCELARCGSGPLAACRTGSMLDELSTVQAAEIMLVWLSGQVWENNNGELHDPVTTAPIRLHPLSREESLGGQTSRFGPNAFCADMSRTTATAAPAPPMVPDPLVAARSSAGASLLSPPARPDPAARRPGQELLLPAAAV